MTLYLNKKAYGFSLWRIFKHTTTNIKNYSKFIRQDSMGYLINFNHYGDIHKKTGWEVDHIIPKAIKPSWWNKFSNLSALQWKENRKKSNKLNFLNKEIHQY